MNEISTLKITNYLIATVILFTGIVFSFTTKSILPFLISFISAALIIVIYKNSTWDYKERYSYFKNSLKEIKKTICQECGTYNPWWSDYCINCGSKLPQEEIECKNCYTLNPPTSTYCGVCGKELKTQNQEATEETEEKKEQKEEEEETQETETPSKQKCPECGYEFSSNVRKCPWCGFKIQK